MARGEQQSVTKPRKRTPNSQQAKVAELAQMRADALDLRIQGWTIRKIAAHFDRHPSTVSDWLDVEMAALITPRAEQLRQMEGERLDAVVAEAMKTMVDNSGTELALKAADRVIRASSRRSELFGIDAPVKLDLGNRAIDSADRELQAMFDEAAEKQRAALREGTAVSPLVDLKIPDYPPTA